MAAPLDEKKDDALDQKTLMGHVRTATFDNGQTVVIKESLIQLINAETTRDGTYILENPIREATLLRSLPPHPNIVTLLLEKHDDQKHQMIFSYAENGDLFNWIVKHGALPEPEVVLLTTQLIEALTHIHLHHVAHLDLSLENLFLKDQGRTIQIGDFGVACKFLPGPQDISWSNQRFPGKLYYADPQIIRENLVYWPDKSDLWSLGVCVWTMLMEFPPYASPFIHDMGFRLLTSSESDGVRALYQAYFQQQKKSSTPCPTISHEALDFLQQLFRVDPLRRATLHDLKQHPWIQGKKLTQLSKKPLLVSTFPLTSVHQVSLKPIRRCRIL